MTGERLRQARLASGLTLDEAVTRLGALGQPLTKAGLSKYEMSKSQPPATTLLKLAQVFGVRSAYFTEEPQATIEWVAFRKQSRLPKGRQEHIKAYTTQVVEGQCWLQDIVCPDLRPQFPIEGHARTLDDAEACAERLRESWRLAELPVESVSRSIEDHGGIVVAWSEDEGKFDGLSGWVNKAVPLVVFNRSVSADRQRYNLAHELGHMMLDCADLPEQEHEGLAHRFAAAFLVPRTVARKELGQKRRHIALDEFGLLKRKYGLSMQGWARRALDVGIIDSGYYTKLCIDFSSRGWRKQEPVMFPGAEEPMKLKQMTLHALAEGVITRERAAQLCPGCVEQMTPTVAVESEHGLYLSAVELMRLPKRERDRIMAAAAVEAEAAYRTDRDLTDFEAFGDNDFFDETP